MISKSELKYIQSLCQKKQRSTDELFIVEGPKLAAEVLASNYQIKKGYATADWLLENKTAVDFVVVTELELERMSGLQTPNQVLLVCQQKNLKTIPSLKNQLTLVVDGIQDPGNLGTIIRIADWYGIKQIIASEDSVDCYNPKVIQSTMGSFIRVDCYYTDLVQLLTNSIVPVYGALLNGHSILSLKKPTEGLLVIGNESKGIREPILPLIQEAITIPRIGGAESLNAAVAAGIILSHLCVEKSS
jgi:TrmH family RNA methyltransferase